MKEIRSAISKDTYDRYMSMPAKKWKEEVDEIIPQAWICGYGYYGNRLEAKDGKYYIVHSIGDSCD